MAPEDRIHKRKMDAADVNEAGEFVEAASKQLKVDNMVVASSPEPLLPVEEEKKSKHRHRHRHGQQKEHRKQSHEKKREEDTKQKIVADAEEEFEEGQIGNDLKRDTVEYDPESKERSRKARSRSRESTRNLDTGKESTRNLDTGKEADDYRKSRHAYNDTSKRQGRSLSRERQDRQSSPLKERHRDSREGLRSSSRERRRERNGRSRSRERRSSSRERRRDRAAHSPTRDRRSLSRERRRERLGRSTSRERRPNDRDYSKSDRVRQRDRSNSRERRQHGDARDSRSSRKEDRRDQAMDGRGRRGMADRHRDSKGQREHLETGAKGQREQDNEEEYAERVALQLKAQEEEEDPEKIKEQSRLRRQAILEKYKKQQQEKPVESAGPFKQDDTASNGAGGEKPAMVPSPRFGSSGPVPSAHTSFADNAQSAKQPENVRVPAAAAAVGQMVEVSNGQVGGAAGLTSTEDRGEAIVPGLAAQKSGEDTVKENGASLDMFSDDIFGESPAGGRKLARPDGTTVEVSGLTDNWDDAEGYYTFRINEVLDGRYEVASSHGRGVFSTVVRAWDLKAGPQDPQEVAIKIIRSNETMYKAGQQELVILKKLAGADPESRRHCVRLLSSFEYRSHLCLVFESLHMNLREILKKFGRNIGINLTAVRSYAMQLLISLKHLRNCGVLHCDIKPDNMLVNEAKNVLKLADFGSAMFAGENEITPYLVSRFYRAPEIMLGLPYDHALDMWSVGCCLYEMYTGKILFPGRTNNDMLRLHIDLKGCFPKKLLKKAAFVDQHFDSEYNFCALEEDPVTKKAVKKIISNVQPKDMGALLAGPGSAEDPKMLAAFKDLLEKMFVLDPAKRINVSQAINHAFIAGK